MKRTLIIPVSVLFLVLLSGCDFSLAQDITPPPGYTPPAPMPTAADASVFPVLPPNPTRGEVVYQEQCANCHGVSGKGDGSNSTNLPQAPSPLAGSADAYTKSLVTRFENISNGISGSAMPAFDTTLDDRTRWDITAYLYMLNNPLEKVIVGKEIFESLCIDCHGINGEGDGVAAKNLPLQPPDFTNQSILPVRSDHELVQIVTLGSSNVMPAFDQALSDGDRAAVVSYIRSLSFSGVQLPVEEVTQVPTSSGSTGTLVPKSGTAPTTLLPTEISSVTINGNVINDSGSGLTERLPVTLQIFDAMQQSGSLQTTTQLDGSFVFNHVEMKTGRIFIASTEYKNQSFNSQPSFHPAAMDAGEATTEVKDNYQLDIHVFETTSDASAVVADRMHIFFDFSTPGTVQVIELFLLSNNGSQVVTPSQSGKGVLDFHIPAEATNLQFQDGALGERFLPVENGFSDTQSIAPGQGTAQVLFAFDLPYSKKLDLAVPISINTNSINVMVPADGIKLKSSQLLDGGLRDSEGMSFKLYTAENLPKDSEIKLTLSGKAPASGSVQNTGQINYVLFGAGIFMLVVTGVGFYFYRRQSQSSKPENDHEGIELTKDELLDAIISLDEQFKNGKLSEAPYQQRRAELKEKLRKLS